jgi:AGZA family xanthine/uracil permease-like MFS transporter
MKDWISGALLFGMIGFLGTMTCVESAEAAGDAYPMAEVMVVDGIGTCMGSIFGGIYGTTVYIGHPVHKALGAKIGYSIVNGVLYLILLSTGIFAWLYNVIPGCANGAILVFVGLLLSRQAFEESPARHYPCILLGMMPFICNMMSLESGGNHSTNMGVQMMAPAGGVVFGMGMCAIACFAIDRKFEEACILSFLAIFASLFGIFASHNAVIDMNGVRGSDHQTLGIYTNKDDAFQGWRWSVAWTMCLVYFAAHIPFQKGNKMAVLQSIPPRIEDDDADPYDESVN